MAARVDDGLRTRSYSRARWAAAVSDRENFLIQRRREFYRRYGRRPLESGSGHQLYYAEDGRTIVDRFGRTLKEVRAAAQLAASLASVSTVIAGDVGAAVAAGKLVLYQVAGARFLSRYDLNAELLTRIAVRESKLAAVMEEAEAEEERTRVELPDRASDVDASSEDWPARAREEGRVADERAAVSENAAREAVYDERFEIEREAELRAQRESEGSG